MSFHRFRPSSHFIPPHSFSNDPCGAVYIPETKEYIICYQWNPGTTEGGNCAWGMAKSKDLVTWNDCSPAIQNGASHDAFGVFSGSIVSRLIEGKRVLFLFYTSVSALPIHWSKPYIDQCESQSVAVSTDFGNSFHRYQRNPLLTSPPKKSATCGWRDPFVSRWPSLSALLGDDSETNYMMIASGERGHGPQLHLYKSDDLLGWEFLHTVLNVRDGSKISVDGHLNFGKNFECASFFTIDGRDYLIVGVEEDVDSHRHSDRYALWICGNLILNDGKPEFEISSHGLLDNGILYAPHIFRDSEDRLLQLGWADEAAKQHVVNGQGWAGCLAHPRELYTISKPIDSSVSSNDTWLIDEKRGEMTTLGVRPAPQVNSLRPQNSFSSLKSFSALRSTNYEVDISFSNVRGDETFTLNLRESPGATEVTKLVINLAAHSILVDRSHTSLESLGTNTPDSGRFQLLPREALKIRVFVDESIVEVYANDRFALTSRIYPSLDSSVGASYDFGGLDENNVQLECWENLQNAWPSRQFEDHDVAFGELNKKAEELSEDCGLARQSTAVFA